MSNAALGVGVRAIKSVESLYMEIIYGQIIMVMVQCCRSFELSNEL